MINRMKAETGKAYRIYGKMPPMKKFKPLNGDRFCSNLIHAEIFEPKNEDQCRKLDREIAFLNSANGGEFELREVAEWGVQS